MKKRLEYLDGLRIYALLNIILLHILLIFRYKYYGTNSLLYFTYTAFDSITRVGVPIFFMLTGILMLNKKEEKDYFIFFKKRVLRLIIAYVIISIIYLLFDIFVNHITITWAQSLEVITSSIVKHHLWYLPVIIMIYILIPYVKKLIDSLKKNELEILIGIIFLMGSCTFLISIITGRLNHELMIDFILPDLMIYMNYLLIGFYIDKYDCKISKTLILLTIISLILLPITTYWISREAVIDLLLNSKSPFVIAPSILVVLYFKNYFKKDSNWIKNSIPKVFYIYLIHILVLETIQVFINPMIKEVSGIKEVGIIILLYIVVTMISYLLASIYLKIKEFFIRTISKKGKI